MQRLLLTLIIGVALLRVAATYRVLCQTVDEQMHIAAGYEWLTSSGDTVNPEHPPLARIAFGVWPRLTAGKPAPGVVPNGNELLFHGGHYERNLSCSRAPNLIFFLIAMVVIYLWSHSLAAVALFSFLYTFNDFFLPLLYVGQAPQNWVLSLGLSEFRSLHQVQWNLTMAATLLVMAPVIILFFLAQRAFVEGVTLTGVKG